jgi:6-phosphogluconolactonase
MNRERLTRKAALTILALLLGVLLACGGGNSASNTNGSRSNNGGGSLSPGTEVLYVGDNVGNIHAFSVDSNTGALTSLSSTAVTNLAAAADVNLAADPSGTALYATSAGLGGPKVVALTINASTGALTAVAANQTLPVPPGGIAIDPLGKNAYVISADQGNNIAELFGFSIDPTTHGLTALPNQPMQLSGVPHDITVDPSGAFVYITFESTPGDEIAGFSRDPNTGLLSVLSGSPFANNGGDSAQGIRVTPNGEFVIVANQATSNVSILALASGTGALTNVSGSPFASGTQPAPVAIDPSSNLVFVGDTGGNTLSAYTIDNAGTLMPVAGTPLSLGTNSQPGSIAVDPADKFIYVSIVPREVAGFTLNPSTGALTPITGSPFSVGQVTRGVVVVKP